MNMKTAPVGADGVDWRSYAAVYDLMAEINPAYQELVDAYRRFATQLWLHPDDLLLELGAGTGNFSLVAADEWPKCRVLHVDANEGMNDQARRKREALGLTNVDMRTARMSPPWICRTRASPWSRSSMLSMPFLTPPRSSAACSGGSARAAASSPAIPAGRWT